MSRKFYSVVKNQYLDLIHWLLIVVQLMEKIFKVKILVKFGITDLPISQKINQWPLTQDQITEMNFQTANLASKLHLKVINNLEIIHTFRFIKLTEQQTIPFSKQILIFHLATRSKVINLVAEARLTIIEVCGQNIIEVCIKYVWNRNLE